jgi:glycosyltransferase involved in cell wall biosynthesis
MAIRDREPAVSGMSFTVVIPAFNEAETVRATVEGLHAAYPDAEIIVVDDGSSDATAQGVEGTGAKVIRHSRNRGYGASLKSGLRAATHDIVVFCDADGQHDPTDVGKLVASMDKADMVIGRRTQLLHSNLWRMPGKWIIGLLANYLSRTKIPDLNSGLRAVRRSIALDYVNICPNGFSMSSTLTIALLAEAFEVLWLPIQIRPRSRTSKSTVKVKTGLDTLLLVLRLSTLFEPLRVFLPIATLFVLAGIAWGVPYALASRGVSIGAMLLIVTGVLTFFFGLLADQNALLRRRRG